MASELLKGFRMLDLTDEKGALCGKIFADLGAEVIKVEPPGGCSTRRIPPFLQDEVGLDRSLYFIAYQAGKKSVTANIESAGGRAIVAELASKCDFLVESFPLGYLDSIGLGYEALAKLNPRLIYTSITPFGDKGPGKDYKWADIITWAAGGMMYLMGEEGKPPIQMSIPQAGLHAGGEAAVSSLIAHYARQTDGLGQQVIVDMQACIVWTLMNEQAMPILHGDHLRRSGVYTGSLGVRRKMVFRCKDGYISSVIGAGPTTKNLIDWVIEAGYGADWMRTMDWSTWTPGLFMKPTEEDLAHITDMEDRIEQLFMTMTKQEIYAQTLKRRLLLAPVATEADIARDVQLKAREYFVNVDHTDTVGRTLTMPGAFAKLSETPIMINRRAPRLGEHNDEIYGSLLGRSAAKLTELRATGAI
jgi:crotonobetainyl-CoA:carnitine CoA-transferase CaiB-like acyl-CoA transferase